MNMGKSTQWKYEMNQSHIDILGISEVKWLELDIFSKQIILFTTQETQNNKVGLVLLSQSGRMFQIKLK